MASRSARECLLDAHRSVPLLRLLDVCWSSVWRRAGSLGRRRPVGPSRRGAGRHDDAQLSGEDENRGADEHDVLAERGGADDELVAELTGIVRSRMVRSAASRSGPSSSSAGPLSTSSCRLRVPTTGARATPSCSPTAAQHARLRSPPASRRAQAGHGEHGLEAAGRAAGARARRRGRRRRGRSRRRRRAVAVQQRPLEHQPGADTGADPEHHQPAVAGVAEGVLAEDGGVGVVRHEDREPRRVGQAGGERGVGPAEVGRVDHGAARRRRRPGCRRRCRASAGRSSRSARRPAGATSATASAPLAPSRSATSRRARTLPARLSTAPGIRSSAERSMPTMWRESAARPTSVGGLADPAPGGGAELLDQALGDQLADQVGDGDPGQSGGRGPGRRGWPGPPGTAAGAAATGGGDGCPPGGACRGAAAAGPPGRSSSRLLVQRTYIFGVKGFGQKVSPDIRGNLMFWAVANPENIRFWPRSQGVRAGASGSARVSTASSMSGSRSISASTWCRRTARSGSRSSPVRSTAATTNNRCGPTNSTCR